MGSNVFQTPLEDIHDPIILSLIRELEHACALPSADFQGQWFYQYLWQCVYPKGAAEKRHPIDRRNIIPGGLLDTKIGKLRDSSIYPFCHDLAMRLNSQSAELVEDTKLYVFFNRYLPVLEQPKRKKH